MKTSALIAALQRSIEECGDLDVCTEHDVSEGAERRQHAPVMRVVVGEERPIVKWGERSGRDVVILG